VLARGFVVVILFATSAAYAAELSVRAVVVKSARVSPQKIVVKAGKAEDVRVSVESAEQRIVITP
jgi:hypothetical protein